MVPQALRNLPAEGPGTGRPEAIGVRHANGRAIVSVLHQYVLSPDKVRTLFSVRSREIHPTMREWGVGLPFVRDVAESHGGSAIVASSASAGTSFLLDPARCQSLRPPRHRRYVGSRRNDHLVD